MRPWSFIVLFGLCLLSCRPARPDSPPPPEAFLSAARNRVSRLDLAARAGQVLLVGVDGRGEVDPSSLGLVEELGPGGVILFGFNIPEAARDLGPFIAALQEASRRSVAGLPLAVAVDHEGGSVFRFKEGLTRLPPPPAVGARGTDYARLLGRRTGLELRALGVNLVLAPVVELLTEENRSLLEARVFSVDPLKADEVAGAFIEGIQSASVAATAKHFPGNAGRDPHEALPRLEASERDLESRYFPRFTSAAKEGVGAVMLSHVLVPAIDSETPASLSPRLVHLLRDRLGFHGLILTDDLLMKSIEAEPERSALLALEAGADLLMFSSGKEARRVRNAIVLAVEEGRLDPVRLEDAVTRVVELKLRFRMEEAFDEEGRARALATLPDVVEESARVLDSLPEGLR